jgi:hypothetical protein
MLVLVFAAGCLLARFVELRIVADTAYERQRRIATERERYGVSPTELTGTYIGNSLLFLVRDAA